MTAQGFLWLILGLSVIALTLVFFCGRGDRFVAGVFLLFVSMMMVGVGLDRGKVFYGGAVAVSVSTGEYVVKSCIRYATRYDDYHDCLLKVASPWKENSKIVRHRFSVGLEELSEASLSRRKKDGPTFVLGTLLQFYESAGEFRVRVKSEPEAKAAEKVN